MVNRLIFQEGNLGQSVQNNSPTRAFQRGCGNLSKLPISLPYKAGERQHLRIFLIWPHSPFCHPSISVWAVGSYSGGVRSSASQVSAVAEFRNLVCCIFKPDLDLLPRTPGIFWAKFYFPVLLLSMRTEDNGRAWYRAAPMFLKR